jgi:hypothetical protein
MPRRCVRSRAAEVMTDSTLRGIMRSTVRAREPPTRTRKRQVRAATRRWRVQAMTGSLVYVAALCAVLALLWPGVAVGQGGGSPSVSGDAGTEGGTKPLVRHPGATTGSHGGVVPPTTGVPPGTQASRSPTMRKAAQPGAAGIAASPVTLNAMQASLLERVNHHRPEAPRGPRSPASTWRRAITTCVTGRLIW